MELSGVAVASPPPSRRGGSVLGVLAFVALAAVALSWAKWAPYSAKLASLFGTHAWSGHDVLAKAGAAGSAPSISGAWSFTRAYFDSVWKALVAGLVIAAGVQSLVPRRGLLRQMRRRSEASSALVGGVLALPSLMCTCCTAPVAVSLRRSGAPASGTLAYWVGNPVLNPAVLAFLALVAPWQWLVTRIVVGLVLVFGATALVARRAGGHGPEPAAAPLPPPVLPPAASPAGFVRALARLSVTLVPEYLVVVFALGLFRGWLFPLGAGAGPDFAVLAVLAAVSLGTLIVIPTAGEIPILLALSAAGAGAGVLGALLITLPAISAVSMTMVARTFGARMTLAMAGAVAACGLLGALVLALLGG